MDFIIVILIAVLGWVSGYFVNYIVEYFPYTRKFSRPFCKSCQTKKEIKEFLQFSPCRQCESKPGNRVWLIQIAYSILFVLLWFFAPERIGFWLSTLLTVYFGIIAIIDIEFKAIMRETSLAGILVGLLIGISMHDLKVTLIGGAVGYLSMLGLFYFGGLFLKLYNKLRKIEIDEVPLGFGDVNLSGIMGLILGWPGIISGLIFAVLLAGVFSMGLVLVQIIRRKSFDAMVIPYAPFILLSAYILIMRP